MLYVVCHPQLGPSGCQGLKLRLGPWPFQLSSKQKSVAPLLHANWGFVPPATIQDTWKGQGLRSPAPRSLRRVRSARPKLPHPCVVVFVVLFSHNRRLRLFRGVNCSVKARLSRVDLFRSRFFMDEKAKTIGLTELLAEVEEDLKQLKAKNPTDYGIKNIMQWWSLESERLEVRHGPQAVIKKMRKAQAFKWMKWFFAGWIVMLVMQTALRFIFP